MRGIRETLSTTLEHLEIWRPSGWSYSAAAFLAAADALGVPHLPSACRYVSWSSFLQTRLLERTGRGIKATAAGMALLAQQRAQIDQGGE